MIPPPEFDDLVTAGGKLGLVQIVSLDVAESGRARAVQRPMLGLGGAGQKLDLGDGLEGLFELARESGIVLRGRRRRTIGRQTTA